MTNPNPVAEPTNSALDDLGLDVDVEVIVSGTRGPLESEYAFRRIVRERQGESDPEGEL
jgi:hypothetical protein